MRMRIYSDFCLFFIISIAKISIINFLQKDKCSCRLNVISDWETEPLFRIQQNQFLSFLFTLIPKISGFLYFNLT